MYPGASFNLHEKVNLLHKEIVYHIYVGNGMCECDGVRYGK